MTVIPSYTILPRSVTSFWDANGLIVEANLATAEMLGVPLTGIINKPFSGFLFKDDQDAYFAMQNAMKKVLATRTAELRLETATGAASSAPPRWAEVQCVPGEEPEGGAHSTRPGPVASASSLVIFIGEK